MTNSEGCLSCPVGHKEEKCMCCVFANVFENHTSADCEFEALKVSLGNFSIEH